MFSPVVVFLLRHLHQRLSLYLLAGTLKSGCFANPHHTVSMCRQSKIARAGAAVRGPSFLQGLVERDNLRGVLAPLEPPRALLDGAF